MVQAAGAEWSAAVAELVLTLGGARFPAALRAAAGRLCAMDTMMVTAYVGAARPRTLFHDLDEVQAAVSADFYETGPYLLDPFYLACRSGVEPGVHRLMDLAPEGFFQSPYYETFYRRIRLTDEVGLMVRAQGDSWIVVSLARGLRRARFSLAEVTALKSGYAVLAAAVLKQWGEDASAAAPAVSERLAAFGASVLSPREAEVARLILTGRNTRSIAEALGCAEGTVKAHRRNAYAKLGVGSQGELFALATRFLGQAGG